MTVNVYLRSISKIDDVNMEYSAQFTFREEWKDARLAFDRFADDNTEVSEIEFLFVFQYSVYTLCNTRLYMVFLGIFGHRHLAV